MKPYQVVFRKEFLEVFRDNRTLLNIVLSPLLITPLLLALVGNVARKQAIESEQEKVSVAVVGLSKAPTVEPLMKNDKLDIQEMSRADAEAQIKSRKIRAAAVFPDDTETKLKNQETLAVTILSDEGSQQSSEGADKLQKAITSAGEKIVTIRLHDNGFSTQFAKPISIKTEGIKGGTSRGLLLLSAFLPYILSLSAIMGGISIANDSVAGEKERGTLETLLVSPASRRDLVIGKFMAVAGVSLVSSVLSIVGLIWPLYAKLGMFAWLTQEGFSLAPSAIIAMLLVQVPLAVLGAGLLLSVSTFARNQRESQTYLAPVILVVTIAAIMSMLLKSNAPLFWAIMPITNAALVLKQALEGVANPAFIGIACVASVIYAAGAVWFATHAFQKESILLKA